MERPNITKQSRWISLSYWVSPTSEAKNYVPTISPEEDNQIRQWVNENYDLYGDDYKMAVYRDAQQAVLDRKATVERKAILERERKERAEKAAYEWDDRTLNEQKQLARAENAINDAATLIRQWQEANWIKVDKALTNKETVDKFLEANLEMPYAEYVNKFLDSQSNWWYYNNEWLAAKFWLNGKEKSVNRRDKFEAWVKWYAQWLADIAQNTLWGAAEYLWSNIAAGIWEWLYWIADFLWADTSEWTAWDKMKKAKWYTWKEAQDAASSEDMWKEWTLSEDVWAFNVWKNLWQATTEIALTAPLEAWVGSAIKAWQIWMKTVQLSKPVKTALQTANLLWWWAAFQLADDAANWERSNWVQYAKTSWLNAATAWLFSIMWKLTPKKVWYTLFAPKWQNQTALLTQSAEDWAKKTNINKAYAKDINAANSPYTEIANDLEDVATRTYWTRTAKWWELEAVEWALQYWEMPYNAKDVVKDLETSFSKIWWWPNAKLPKFTIDWKTLKIDKEWLETLNWITKTQDGVTIKLWDEIQNLWNNTFTRLDNPIDATNTKLFIDWLKDILKDAWYSKTWWKTIRAMKNALNWAGDEIWIVKKFENSLSDASTKALSEARTAAKEAITTDENVNKVLWTLRNTDMIWKVWAAEKALWWKAQMQELFKEIKEKYWIDMNNEILAWAYNMSLYDVKKAQQILDTFYPSTPWLIEAVLRVITKTWRRKYAEKVVEWWKDYVEWMSKYTKKPVVWWEIGSTASTRTNLMWENEREE